jgi:hypothetical protein
MNPSETDDKSDKKPQIRRREIGALFQAETLEWPEAYAAAGLATAPDAAPSAHLTTVAA